MSTDPEISYQPRSSIAPVKGPVEDTTSDRVTNANDVAKHSTSDEPAKSIKQMEALGYSTLCLPNIRLITISPSTRDGTLQVFLKEAPLHALLEYHALSYVWGDTADKKTIIVNNHKLDIAMNLYDFLETTRRHEGSFLAHHTTCPDYSKSYTSRTAETESDSASTSSAYVPTQWWIDAICINQDDVGERNKQVPRMGDIYSMASRVWVWLGLPSKIFARDSEFADLKRALAFHVQDGINIHNANEQERQIPKSLIQQFSDYQRQLLVKGHIARMEALGSPITPGPMMDAVYQGYSEATDQLPPNLTHVLFNNFLELLADLLGQPYFSRTWIIQEYILNPRPPVALIGRFVFDLDHIVNLASRLVQEHERMDAFIQVRVNAVFARVPHLLTISTARERWHNTSRYTIKLSDNGSALQRTPSLPKETFSCLPLGEKLSYLLNLFTVRRCANPLDYFYGFLGLVNHHELPRTLLPDYSLPFHQVSYDYTRYIIESTGNLTMIESGSGFSSTDCPSWVPDVNFLNEGGREQHITVSEENKSFFFSADGCLTLMGTKIGEIIACSCASCPTEYNDKNLEFVQEIIFEGAAQITGKSIADIFESWYKVQLGLQDIEPALLPDITSMEGLIQRYRDLCKDIPLDAQTGFGRMLKPDMYVLLSTPCEDPVFLYTFLCMATHRYCLLSTGDIVTCGLKGTCPSHSWNDCAWALKGLNSLAILRPKGQDYEYWGLACSSKKLLTGSAREEAGHEFDLNDEFFAAREIQQVTLV